MRLEGRKCEHKQQAQTLYRSALQPFVGQGARCYAGLPPNLTQRLDTERIHPERARRNLAKRPVASWVGNTP